jgi:hypothetical protein
VDQGVVRRSQAVEDRLGSVRFEPCFGQGKYVSVIAQKVILDDGCFVDSKSCTGRRAGVEDGEVELTGGCWAWVGIDVACEKQ